MKSTVPVWLLILSCAVPCAGVELFTNTPRDVVIAPQNEVTLVTGLTFLAPPGVRSVRLEMHSESGADVDLFVRFGRNPTSKTSAIDADFSSENAGSSDESVEINTNTAPPIQTGVYYIGLLVKTTGVEIPLEIKVTADVSGAERTFITSTFDVDDEGWTRNFPPSGISGATTGDANAIITLFPSGVLRLSDLLAAGSRDAFVAPPKFLGNLASFSDAEFRFDIRKVDGPAALYPVELRVIGGGSAWVFRGPLLVNGEWTAVTAALDSPAWRRVAGNASFQTTLSGVERIEVSMDHTVGPEQTDFDNFVFEGGPGGTPTGSGGPNFSDFETGLDGWSRNFPASPIPGASIGSEGAAIRVGDGGSASESFLMAIDGGEGGVDFLVAPPKFIAGLATLDRPWYEFDYRHIEGAFPDVGLIVRLLGNGSAYMWRGGRPREEWRTVRVPVDERYWVHESGPADFGAMLRGVQRLEISMDNTDGPEVNGLDNFHLRTGFTPPGGRSIELTPGQVSISVEGEDRTAEESFEISGVGADLDWQARVDPPQATWLTLSKYEGRTPDASLLMFDAEGLQPGVYRAEVVVSSPEFALTPQHLQVDFTVGADPRIPVALTAISAGDPAAPLSPGGLATIYGRYLAAESRAVSLESYGGLPVNADGFEIRVLDLDGNVLSRAPLLYLSPTQVNFQMPYEAAGLVAVDLFAVRAGVIGARLRVGLSPAGPAIFAIEGGLAAVVNSDGTLNSQSNPAPAGSRVTVYFTGLGPAEPAVPTGRTAGSRPASIAGLPYSATIDGSPAPTFGAALSPGYVGLAQMTVEIPGGFSGRGNLQIAVGGLTSNAVFVWVR